MRLLLDTHTFIWLIDGSPRISVAANASLVDPANELFFNIASVWEMAIKINRKKLSLSLGLDAFVIQGITAYGIKLLRLTVEDCVEYVTLPFPLQQHRDPFDRMIIVHAQRHGLTVVGTDPNFDAYGVTRLW
ncbi:MAG TPA: type II toxin-antitoxin system VapC family toxin [Gemmataceae bacterium]|jgi:PIN domain nuclease of toxin-antitoxin system|nr:type II toxin-antitoxin system VapC family toxin [Gemmataceae bacterium]